MKRLQAIDEAGIVPEEHNELATVAPVWSLHVTVRVVMPFVPHVAEHGPSGPATHWYAAGSVPEKD